MSDPLTQLKERLTKSTDLERIGRVLSWDHQTMMPPAGSGHRAEHLATLRRISHELLTDDETGRLLDELRPLEESLDADSDDGALIRLVRRDFEKAVRVPAELRAEMTRAGAHARPIWVKARAESSFEQFLPALERNVEVDDSFLQGTFPIDRQESLAKEVVSLFGYRPDTWRLDPTEHPFASGAGVDDIRITTHYDPDSIKSLFSTMHEYGHGLYTHQLPRHLERLPTGGPCSLGIHESQSRLWENLVGRSRPFWRFFYSRAQEAFPERLRAVELDAFLAGINRVRPSLIRIRADEVTYGMHIVLRFELEQDIINGRVDLSDLPEVWNERMSEYLGVDVPDDAQGVLQDTLWDSGLIGYFATYLLGTVMSVQIWQKALEDLPTVEEQIERGEFASLRKWLGEHVHRHGKKFSPQETLRRATGTTLDPKPYVAYLRTKYGAGVAA